MKGTLIYRRWFQMRARVRTKPRYLGRVTVCERWQTFENFYADMGEPPTPQHTIDRINNDGNYEPGNCRWATPREQAANRRDNVWLETNGERRLLIDWARRLGVPSITIRLRLKRGWDITRAVTTPTLRSATRGQNI